VVILGINAYHGDAAAALVVDGVLVAAAEEERFTRIKHCAGFPTHAVRYCLHAAGLDGRQVDCIAIARDPRARLAQKLRLAARMPRRALERWRVQRRVAGLAADLARALDTDPAAVAPMVRRVEHHRAHLASAFLVSPFDEAALFSIDGLGDFASAMWGVGRGRHIEPHGTVVFPHSLGIFYTALTQYLGFPRYGDEYKVMGLASYGQPEFLDEFRRIVLTPRDGITFRLGLDYFVHHRDGVDMTWEAGEPRIGPLYSAHLVRRLGAARAEAAAIETRHQNVAASLQARLEEVVLGCLERLQRETGLRRLCLAGGVAFNCVANGKVLARTGFEEMYVQSAAGDAGLAIGAAMDVWHRRSGGARGFVMAHAYWGPQFADAEIEAVLAAQRGALTAAGVSIRRLENGGELCSWTADRLAAGKVVGWFQGRMEWGPRALGNRSILADPRRAEMREVLNAKIKRREAFRPFAPAILEEHTGAYFEHSHPSPFMLMAYPVRAAKRRVIPATTHVDGTGRLQTVNRRQNPRFYDLIEAFYRRTDVPVLLNTSFNENEPVVCTPEEALDCFVRTRMDVLVLGDWVLERQDADAPPLP
jgi:carbamoyltransferase